MLAEYKNGRNMQNFQIVIDRRRIGIPHSWRTKCAAELEQTSYVKDIIKKEAKYCFI